MLGKINDISSCSVKTEDDKVVACVRTGKGDCLRPEIARLVIKNDWDLYEMNVRKNSLEDVFRTLTTGGEINEK